MYTVFKRAWWKWELVDGVRTKVPHATARKTRIQVVDTEEAARLACKQYNDNHDEGPLSVKAEYTAGSL